MKAIYRFFAVPAAAARLFATRVVEGEAIEVRKWRKLSRSFAAFFLFLFFLPALAFAQTATVTGTVSDSSGAVVPQVRVTARNITTNVSRSVQTGDTGIYRISNLAPGRYEVVIELSGFNTFRFQDLELTVGQELTLDAHLKVSSVTETVTVSGDAVAPIELSNAQLSNVVDQRRVESLPLVTRDPYELVLLAPGVIQSNSGLGGFAVNGSRERNNNFLLDGADNNDADVPGIAGGITGINPDSTREFRIITNNFLAEYGRNTGAIIDVVTKSGTNQLRGTAYWFGRYDALAARDFFSTSDEADPFVRNQFGVSVGGPILKNRSFWFANYEGQRFRTALVNQAVVPTAEFKTGRFTFSGRPVDVTNPSTPNNVFAGTLDPRVQQVLALFPNPNGEAVDDVRGVFRFPSRSAFGGDNFTVKVDHAFSPVQNFFARYTFNEGDNPNAFNAEVLPGFGGISTFQRTQSLSLNHTSTFRPTLVNEFRFGANRTNLRFGCTGLEVLNSFGPVDTFGRTQDLTLPGIADFSCDALGNSDGQARFTGTYSYYDALSWVKGRHTVKVGGEVRFVYSNNFTSFSSRTLADFAAFSNFGVASVDIDPFTPGVQIGSQTLQDLVHVLFGTVAIQSQSQFFSRTGVRTADDLRGFRQREIGTFVQDSWKVAPNLTVNLGVRWEFYGVPFEVNNNFTALLPDASGLAPFTFTVVGRNTGVLLYENDFNNFAPRVGIAWDPFRKGKTSIRAGYGMFFDRVFGNLLGNARGNPPFQGTFLDFPFTQLSSTSLPTDLTPSAIVQDGDGVFPTLFQRDFRTPYSQNWNLGLQHELFPSLLVEVNYVGSKGTKLFRVVDGNSPNSQLVAQLVAFCSDPNNAFGCSEATLQRSNLFFGFERGRIPFNAVRNNAFFQAALNTTQANSTYHALQANITKRFSKGFQIQGAYTWSHAIDDASDPIVAAAGNRSFPRDSRNLLAERGNSDFDQTQRLVINYLWELPLGRGRAYLKDGWISKALEGWQIAGITTFADGIPFDIFGNRDSAHTGLNGRVDILPAPDPANTSPTNDPRRQTGPGRDRFALAPFGRAGNLSRNRFRGSGIANFDVVSTKVITITERFRLDFRTEVFNLFNRVQFNQPGNLFQDPGTFGFSTSQAGRPDGTSGARQIQYALKLHF